MHNLIRIAVVAAKSDKLFPTILVGLSLCAAVRYGYEYNWRMVIYWMASAAIISSVTF